MDDELSPWTNAWGSTTDLKTPSAKPNASPSLSPAWPTSSAPIPSLPEPDGWGPSAWGSTTATTNTDDTGGGWGDSLEYDTQVPETIVLHTEPAVPVELKEEEEPEFEVAEATFSPSEERRDDIPHSPLPSSPPAEWGQSQTTDSRTSSPSPSYDIPVPLRTSIDASAQELPVTPRVSQHAVPVSSPRPDSDLDDSFGGFATVKDTRLGVSGDGEEDPWSPAPGDLTFPSSRTDDGVVASGGAWGDKDETQSETSPAADEWEQARIRKERMDRKVPPEVLSGYLTKWEAVVTELWPDAPLPRSEPTADWRSPLEEISEVQALRKLYRLPILTTALSSPPPPLTILPPYNSTRIHTRQRAALKSTRVSAVAQQSPFAHLTSARSIQAANRFSSKPSVSISRSSLEFGDGVVGVGWAWAHDEKKKSEPVVAPPLVAPPLAAPTVVSSSTPSPSPTPSTPTAGRFSGFWSRARGSTDKAVGQGSRSGTPVPLTSPSTSSLGETAKPAPPTLEPPIAAESAPSPSPSDPSPVAPAESTVSRFFKRFSRSNPLESERTRLATSESVSLSASDLEFLADSVPDTTEKSLLDGGRGLTEFDALEAMLRAKPLPKDVPVLAPPPRMGSSGIPSPLAAVPEDSKTAEDDLWDIFGAPPAATSNGQLNSTLPSSRRASLTPQLTTPVSSAPASRSHTPRLPSVADLATMVGGKGSHLRQTSFSARPQHAFSTDIPSLDSSPVPALPPPPGSGSLVETDAFADFMSGPISQPVQTSESSARASFDDFGDFESSAPVITQAIPAPPAIRSPSPPKPPSKSGTPVYVRTGPTIQRVESQSTGSALPPLLPPPSAPSRSMTPILAPPPRANTPLVSPPSITSPPPTAPQINLFDFGSSPPKNNAPIPAPSFTTQAQTQKPPAPSGKGGLSASDLSFFEGL